MAAKAKAADEIASLFQLPLDEFTKARDALAARLKSGGDAAAAARVKGLAKPTLSAWVVNQLYWRERARFDELVHSVAALRAAHQARAELRGPLEARRRALVALNELATQQLRAAGGNPTPDMTRRIAGTLEAVATLGVEPGALVRDLDPPGFEALAGWAPAAAAPAPAKGGRGAGPSRVLPFAVPAGKDGARGSERRLAAERDAARAAARQAVIAAETQLERARDHAQSVTQAGAAARGEAQEASREVEKLERLLLAAKATSKTRTQELRRLDREGKDASEAVAAAEQELQQARRKLETV